MTMGPDHQEKVFYNVRKTTLMCSIKKSPKWADPLLATGIPRSNSSLQPQITNYFLTFVHLPQLLKLELLSVSVTCICTAVTVSLLKHGKTNKRWDWAVGRSIDNITQLLAHESCGLRRINQSNIGHLDITLPWVLLKRPHDAPPPGFTLLLL